MRQFLLMFVLGLGLSLFPQNIFAHEGMDHMESSEAVGAVASGPQGDLASLKEVGNTICPVSGDKVGQMGEAVKYEYNGKIYNLCCPMCKKDFANDPEKFSKKAEEQAAEEGAVTEGESSMHGTHEHGGGEHK